MCPLGRSAAKISSWPVSRPPLRSSLRTTGLATGRAPPPGHRWHTKLILLSQKGQEVDQQDAEGRSLDNSIGGSHSIFLERPVQLLVHDPRELPVPCM